MNIFKKEDILEYDIDAFVKDYSEILKKHSHLISKISSSQEGKKRLKQELLLQLINH